MIDNRHIVPQPKQYRENLYKNRRGVRFGTFRGAGYWLWFNIIGKKLKRTWK